MLIRRTWRVFTMGSSNSTWAKIEFFHATVNAACYGFGFRWRHIAGEFDIYTSDCQCRTFVHTHTHTSNFTRSYLHVLKPHSQAFHLRRIFQFILTAKWPASSLFSVGFLSLDALVSSDKPGVGRVLTLPANLTECLAYTITEWLATRPCSFSAYLHVPTKRCANK